MEEFVKYIQSLECRIAVLEAAVAKEPAQDARIEALLRQQTELLARISELEAELARQKELIVALDEETGEPELEVEIIEEEEEADTEVEAVAAEEPAIEEPAIEEPAQPEPVVAPEPVAAPEPVVIPEPVVVEEPKVEAPRSVVPKVEDIRKAISLGDRFLFQRELFGGNGEAMMKAISDLNALPSLEEAEAYVARQGWNSESHAYELFMAILKRRW